MDGLSKYYYLVALSFWLQQLVVVNIEERRKDHLQMFTHHMITCALVFASYCYHQTNVGNVILCLMDVVDLFLPLAKILKYLKFRLVCDIAFGGQFMHIFLKRPITAVTEDQQRISRGHSQYRMITTTSSNLSLTLPASSASTMVS
jgi:very-long-chain ceramide synthase